MSASVKGKQLVWGVPDGVKTAAEAAFTTGIVESASVARGGSNEDIADEDGKYVTRVDHGGTNQVEITVKALDDSTVPEAGDVLTGLGTIDGVNLDAGSVIVDEAKEIFAGAGVKKLSITATHLPDCAE